MTPERSEEHTQQDRRLPDAFCFPVIREGVQKDPERVDSCKCARRGHTKDQASSILPGKVFLITRLLSAAWVL